MKIDYIKTTIAICICLFIAYGFYSFHQNENKFILSLGSFIFLAITLVFTIGTTFESTRTSTNVKTISGLFFVIAFLTNLIFLVLNFSITIYIIITGIAILNHSLIVYSICRARQ